MLQITLFGLAMGNDQSQASGRQICKAGVIIWDGQNIRQLVDISRDTSYTDNDIHSIRSMMAREVQLVEYQLSKAVSCIEELDKQHAERQNNYITDK